jgi:hypothetical protein
MALVTVLFLLALLMVQALVLSDKVIRVSRGTGLAGARDQALQAAGAGIEWSRHQLAASYRATSGWAAYLAAAPDGERYPDTPALSTVVGDVPVDIFLRDNPDGDGDRRHDNDLQLYVLACARAKLGPDVRVEALCRLAADGGGYRQAGSDARHSGAAAAAAPDEPWLAPVSSFHLLE